MRVRMRMIAFAYVPSNSSNYRGRFCGSLAQAREHSHHERLILAVFDVGAEARSGVYVCLCVCVRVYAYACMYVWVCAYLLSALAKAGRWRSRKCARTMNDRFSQY